MQVRLIGFCVEGSLFLVYEYINNGNLSQHLRGKGKYGYFFLFKMKYTHILFCLMVGWIQL